MIKMLIYNNCLFNYNNNYQKKKTVYSAFNQTLYPVGNCNFF